MNQSAQYIRTGHTIKDLATGKRQTFKSISQAKQWSRDWQKANGGLGIGKLRVE